ncbi:MAG: T9SS type A sorting domain-containing protein [Prevotellaceae bacterium]|nr:T9SS type A sorting domain-containing protein [Prevotellaceae bacterium]
MSVYPNPASDRIFIEGENFDAIKLYDILGKEVLSSNKTKEINISNLPNGVYSVRIIADNKTIAAKKIVKK